VNEVERLRSEVIEGWAGFADEYGPRGRLEIVKDVDDLIAAVRADEREQFHGKGSLHIVWRVNLDLHGDRRLIEMENRQDAERWIVENEMTDKAFVERRTEWHGPWRKIEEARDAHL